MNDRPAGIEHRVEALLGKRSLNWSQVAGGYTPAQRYVVTFQDRTSCFAKAATNTWTAEALRAEYNVYSQVTGSFLPRLLAWEDDALEPLLVLEDLSSARWPPPWRLGDIEDVLESLPDVHRAHVTGLPDVRSHYACQNLWPKIEAEPDGFLSLGLASRRWLQASVPVLRDAADRAPFQGEQVIHFDVRSDNLCFDGGRCRLVDWNHASIGNGDLDVATWLPSLEAEGGPTPETIFPDGGEFAAWMSGFWAGNAALPSRSGRLREITLAQLRSALPWAIRSLGLPPLDGPEAPK
jgi:hypothetical protein